MPLILAFDSSAAHCAAALFRHGHITALHVQPMQQGQAEALIPLLETLLKGQDLNWSDLDALGVGIGPGNFTGIRIAVAAARGLALGLGIPAIGVSAFEAAVLDQPRPAIATLPAPREQIYRQRFLSDGPETPEILPGLADPQPAADLVTAIARIAATRHGVPSPRPAPFYMRAADAAPPRDPPPVILP